MIGLLRRGVQISQKYPYSFLFCSIIVLFTVDSFRPNEFNIIIVFLFLAIMLSTVWAMNLQRNAVLLCCSLGVAAFGLSVLDHVILDSSASFWLHASVLLLYISFFLICIVIFLKKVFFSKTANWDSIQGGISIYFLMGILWAFLYQMVLLFDPTAIQFPDTYHSSDAFYLSFTTLSTLGYGDILPVSRVARNLTTMESMLGQIFLTVFLARLIGLHVSSSR